MRGTLILSLAVPSPTAFEGTPLVYTVAMLCALAHRLMNVVLPLALHFVVPTEFKNGKAYALIIDVFDDRTYPAS